MDILYRLKEIISKIRTLRVKKEVTVIKIHRFSIPKSILLGLGEKERIFFMCIGHFLNEISILQKCIMYVPDPNSTNKVEADGRIFLHLFFIRMLASKLCECHKMFEKAFYGTALSNDFKDSFNEETKKKQKEIKRYFSKDNNLKIIRNGFGFHYDPEKLEEGLSWLEKGEEKELKMYQSKIIGNCLYTLCEVALFASMRNALIIPDNKDPIKTLYDEVLRISKLFQDFGYECLKIIVDRFPGLDHEECEIANPNRHCDVKLPYFIDEDYLNIRASYVKEEFKGVFES